MNKTSMVAARITQTEKETTKYGITANKYINPQEITTRLNDKIRNDKQSELELWE